MCTDSKDRAVRLVAIVSRSFKSTAIRVGGRRVELALDAMKTGGHHGHID
jgi:hypothetical protein